MDSNAVRSLLDQFLSNGNGLARKVEDAAATRFGVGSAPADRARLRETGLAGGAAIGVLAMLMGGRRRSTFSRKALLVGGLGALGKIAYDAWQKNQGAQAGGQRALADLSDESEAEGRAATLLYALVAAAKADGHVDEEERSAIEAEMDGLPQGARDLMREALAATPSPEHIAARVTGGQEAREVYAASALLTGRDHPGEADHLDRLARALGLSDDEARSIEGSLHAV